MDRGPGRVEVMGFVKSARVDLPQTAYETFWKDLENPIYRGETVQMLVKHAVESGRWGRFGGISVEVTIATLAVIILAEDSEADSGEYRRVLEEAKRRLSSSHLPCVDQYLSPLLTIAMGEPPFQTLQTLAEQTCSASPLLRPEPRLTWSEAKVGDLGAHFGWGGPEIHPNQRFNMLNTGFSALFHSYLHHQLSLLTPHFNAVLDLFYPILVSHLKQIPEKQFNLMHILHCLEVGLTVFPVYSVDSLEQVGMGVDLVRRQPKPQAVAAQRVLRLLYREKRCPGLNALLALEVNFPFILTPKSRGFGSQLASAVLFFSPTESPEPDLFENMEKISRKSIFDPLKSLNSTLYQSEECDLMSFLSHVTRIQAISYIFHRFGGISNPPELINYSVNQIFTLYLQIKESLVGIFEENSDAFDGIFSGKIGEIMSEIEGWECDLSDFTSHLTAIYFGEGGKLGVFPLCPLSYISAYPVESQYSQFSSVLGELYMRMSDPSSVFYGRNGKVVVCGSDRMVHWFVCAYVRKYAEFQASSVDVRVYILPDIANDSTLAAYVASVDSWYSRYLYTPFAKRPFPPRLMPFSDSNSHPRKGTTELTGNFHPIPSSSPNSHHFSCQKDLKPSLVLHNLLQDYLNTAKSTIYVKILRVKCWRGVDVTDTEPDLTLPMCLYLDIGLKAREMRVKIDNLPDIRQKHDNLNVFLSVYRMDLMGNVSDKPEDAIKSIHSLTISNVSRASDYWKSSKPELTGFELAFLESRAVSDYLSLTVKPQKHSKMKLADYETALHGLHTNVHISRVKVMCTSSATPMGFDVLVDGVLYGPFGGLEVEEWLESDAQVQLKVATFLDTQ